MLYIIGIDPDPRQCMTLYIRRINLCIYNYGEVFNNHVGMFYERP